MTRVAFKPPSVTHTHTPAATRGNYHELPVTREPIKTLFHYLDFKGLLEAAEPHRNIHYSCQTRSETSAARLLYEHIIYEMRGKLMEWNLLSELPRSKNLSETKKVQAGLHF